MHQIRMAQPGKNALSTGLMAFLEAELHKADGEPILLTGEGDAFSAGVDLREIAAADAAAIERFLRRLDALVARINLYPAPVVALVNGHAIAGGCILALACDWRVAPAGTKAKIGLNELALGACIPPACLRVVRQRLGERGAERAEQPLPGLLAKWHRLDRRHHLILQPRPAPRCKRRERLEPEGPGREPPCKRQRALAR